MSGADGVFISYGRAARRRRLDRRLALCGVHYDAEAEELTSEVVLTEPVDDDGSTADGALPTEPATGIEGGTEPVVDPAASPVGSDLWLDEFTDERSVTTRSTCPTTSRCLLATDGTAPAPTDLAIAWPLDNSTPWAGPLLAGGALVFLGGIALLVSGLRASPSFTRPPSQPAQGPPRQAAERTEAADARQSQVGSGSGAAPSVGRSGSPSCR